MERFSGLKCIDQSPYYSEDVIKLVIVISNCTTRSSKNKSNLSSPAILVRSEF